MLNKKIAINTIILYIRMIFIIIITFLSSRILLNAVGVENYGIINVIGGVVIIIGFINNSMTISTQRFLSFELGKKDYGQLNKTFIMSINLHIIIAIILLIISESLGLWIVNNILNIPNNKYLEANYIFQFSTFSFITNIILVPYNASIISREKMNVYSYISIVEVILKLGIVYLLLFSSFNKLILYSALNFIISVIILCITIYYCRNKIKECKYNFYWNYNIFKKLYSFFGWNLIENFAQVSYLQGTSILLNIFFGPIINTSRGISMQINSSINQLSATFNLAIRPQIVKSYAMKEINKNNDLVIKSSLLSFILISLFSIPLMIKTDYIINFWLGCTPTYSVVFTRLILIYSLINSFSFPLISLINATGNIRKYQIINGLLLVSNLPLSFILLKLGYEPSIVYIVSIIICILSLAYRVIYLHKTLDFDSYKFIRKVILPSITILITSIILLYTISNFINNPLINLSIITMANFTIVAVFIIIKFTKGNFSFSNLKNEITQRSFFKTED